VSLTGDHFLQVSGERRADVSRGSIQRRGRQSWRIRFEDGDAAGRRKRHTVTLKGSRKDLQSEPARLLAAPDAGTLPRAIEGATVADHLRAWLDGSYKLSRKRAVRLMRGVPYRCQLESGVGPHASARSRGMDCRLYRQQWRAPTADFRKKKGC